MKIFISAIVAFALIIATTGIYSKYLEKTLSEIDGFRETIDNAVQNRDWEACESGIDDLITVWEKKKKTLETFIRHSEVDTINQLIQEIKSYADFKNQEETMVRIQSLEMQLKHVKETESVSMENILSTEATLST